MSISHAITDAADQELISQKDRESGVSSTMDHEKREVHVHQR